MYICSCKFMMRFVVFFNFNEEIKEILKTQSVVFKINILRTK